MGRTVCVRRESTTLGNAGKTDTILSARCGPRAMRRRTTQHRERHPAMTQPVRKEEVVKVLECETKNDIGGSPYVRVRADIYMRHLGQRTGEIMRRTIMVRGEAYDALAEHIRPEAELLILGYHRRVFSQGRPGGWFFEATDLVQVLGLERAEAANDDEPTHMVEGHDRRPHFRKYKGGVLQHPNDWIPIRGSKVNGGRKAA